MRTCSTCRKEKASSEFPRSSFIRKDGTRSLLAQCKACKKKRADEWRWNNPERYREIQLRSHRKHLTKRKIARKKWNEANRFHRAIDSAKRKAVKFNYLPCCASVPEIASAFTGRCHACGARENGKKLHMDHCHETGKFRGWLCNNCNIATGYLSNSVERLVALTVYMKNVKT